MAQCPKAGRESAGAPVALPAEWEVADTEADLMAQEPAIGEVSDAEYTAYDLIAPLDAAPEWQ
jgi:hypothetical protein